MTKLKIFLVAQLVFGSLLGFLAERSLPLPYDSIGECFYIGLVASHVSLLGFWAGMGLSAWWKRLPGFFAGVLCLWFVGSLVTRHFDDVVKYFMFVNAGVVAVISFFLGWFGVRLQKISEQEQVNPAPKMQFTIRGLFMVTFCAALLLLLASICLDKQLEDRLGLGMIFFYFLELALVIIFATLLCMWAALSLASPIFPMVVAMVAVLSMYLVLFVSFKLNLSDMQSVQEIGTFLLSHFGWTLATLLVVRSYGYRMKST